MTKPQQPEIRRSERTPGLAPDVMDARLDARDQPGTGPKTGPVPKANRPGTTSGPVQDKPDMDDFIARASGDGGDPADALPSPVMKVLKVGAAAAGVGIGITQVVKRYMR